MSTDSIFQHLLYGLNVFEIKVVVPERVSKEDTYHFIDDPPLDNSHRRGSSSSSSGHLPHSFQLFPPITPAKSSCNDGRLVSSRPEEASNNSSWNGSTVRGKKRTGTDTQETVSRLGHLQLVTTTGDDAGRVFLESSILFVAF